MYTNNSKEGIMDITFIIKTFERHDKIENLLKSIKYYYPDIPIIITDDSYNPIPITGDNIEWYALPFDSGLSAGRNFMVDKVKTKYFLLLDDDFVFSNETVIENFYNILENSDIDIIGGNVKNLDGKLLTFNGILSLGNDNILRYKKDYYELFDNYVTCDMVLNFFLAKTETIFHYNWDVRQKLAEHTAFFWCNKGNIKVAYTDTVLILHDPERTDNYNEYRLRSKAMFDEWMIRNKINGIIDYNGNLFKSSLYSNNQTTIQKVNSVNFNTIDFNINKDTLKPLGYWLKVLNNHNKELLLNVINKKRLKLTYLINKRKLEKLIFD